MLLLCNLHRVSWICLYSSNLATLTVSFYGQRYENRGTFLRHFGMLTLAWNHPGVLFRPNATSGVTGNPIRAYTDPGGLDPLAESIRRIGFAGGSDPTPDAFLGPVLT